MKKYLLLFLFFLAGCTLYTSPTEVATEYFDNYINLDEDVLESINEYSTDMQEVLKRQYSNMKYTITLIEETEDTTNLLVEIEVYNFNNSEDNAFEYLKTMPEELYVEGKLDEEAYISYKLDLMLNEESRISYEITVTLTKEDNKWIMNELSEEDIQKIEGTYNEDD